MRRPPFRNSLRKFFDGGRSVGRLAQRFDPAHCGLISRPGWASGLFGHVSQDGLKAVFLAQRPLLLRLLKARLRSTEDAEDCLQDLWLKLDQLADRPVGNPAAFLFRAASNLATDRRIAAGRRSARDHAWSDHLPVAQDLPDAERTLAARQEWESLDRVIGEMPDRMATALRLFRLEGAGQRAIAEQLGVSVSAVEKLLKRAYRQLADVSRTRDGEIGGPRRHDCEGSAERDG